MTVTTSSLHRHITRSEAILDTPGVTTIDWDHYTSGEDPQMHLAYLQRIAQHAGFSLGLPAEINHAIREINRARQTSREEWVGGEASTSVGVA